MRRAIAGVAALLACRSDALAQNAQAPLPDVTVIAPAVPQHVNPFKPYSSNTRVEDNRNCVAVERLGPPWHGGYVWVVHASICRVTATPLQNADIDAVFAMLQLRQYDAQGNPRGPGR